MKERGITYKRKHYNNYVELSDDYGISKDNLMHRLYLGWSLEESLTRKVSKKQTKNSYKVRGITYSSKTEACIRLGLDTCLVHRTWKYLGSSWEESVEFLLSFIERLGGNRPDIVSFILVVIYNGIWCRDDKEFCKLCNVDYVCFKSFKLSNRLSSSYEVMKDYTSRGMYIYKYRGKEYNKTEIEKVKGIGHGTKPEVILRDREITRKYVLIEREHKFNPTGYCLYVKDLYMTELQKAKRVKE